jgi:hypothetical protein
MNKKLFMICRGCRKLLPIEEFHKYSSKLGEILIQATKCKDCAYKTWKKNKLYNKKFHLI